MQQKKYALRTSEFDTFGFFMLYSVHTPKIVLELHLKSFNAR